MEAITKTRRIGGSIVTTIPKEVAEKLKLKENELIEIEIKRVKKSFFGAIKGIPSFKEDDRFDRA
ncbi:MAG: AbrB/MazE/SpoVT family DNA-binding domain-containing protein [archaeon]